MTYKTHMNFGLFLAILFIFNLQIFDIQLINVFINILVVIFASLLPDIDIKHSYISNRRIIAMPILIILTRFNIYKIILIVIWYVLSRHYGHRKVAHSILSIILFLILFHNSPISIYFFIGYTSHILLDMISGGVFLFFPIFNKRIGINLIKTDSMMEFILMIVLLVINIVMILQAYITLSNIF